MIRYKAVIFDMDGVLIDSEPIWYQSANEVLSEYGIQLSPLQYATTTGLRTKEFVEWWFKQFNLPMAKADEAIKEIIALVINTVNQKGRPLPGVQHIFNFFIAKQYKIGLATSSPLELVEVVVAFLGIKDYIHAISSAGELPYGKPHPQVYIDCANSLNMLPLECICFEDSFNGMIAAKAAKMKCVVVPSAQEFHQLKWHAADLKISSLLNFNELLLQSL